MKLLFDQNISFRIITKLSPTLPLCKHISNVGLLNKDDLEIWNYAKENNFHIVTFDSDFFDIGMVKGAPPKIIWIRQGNLSTKEIAILIENNQLKIKYFLDNSGANENHCMEI